MKDEKYKENLDHELPLQLEEWVYNEDNLCDFSMMDVDKMQSKYYKETIRING